MAPFLHRSSSVRQLDLRGRTPAGANQIYTDQQCTALIRSPLGIRCEFLQIEVETRTSILDLVKKMAHLRTLNVRCRDRQSNDQELLKWLQARVPSTCSFAKDSSVPSDIRIWIR